MALKDFDLLAQRQVLGDQSGPWGQEVLKDEEQIQHPGPSLRPLAKIVKSRKAVLDCAYAVFRRDNGARSYPRSA